MQAARGRGERSNHYASHRSQAAHKQAIRFSEGPLNNPTAIDFPRRGLYFPCLRGGRGYNLPGLSEGLRHGPPSTTSPQA